MPMVSVIIPTYNLGPYLRESLDSVLGQDSSDIEVIVVDDGSTDDTPRLLASYGDRIRVIHADHAGCAAARNVGLAHARGRWIAFHDADDVAEPHRISTSLAFLQAHPEMDAVFFNGKRMGIAGAPAARVVPREFAGRLLDPGCLFAGYCVYYQGALVPRELFAAAGPFDATYLVEPDLEYAYRLFTRCRATFVDEVVFQYRWHATNMTRDRLSVREELVRILDQLPTRSPAAVAQIGERVLRRRAARHHFRIGRVRLRRGDALSARASFARAAGLQPFHLRYQWARMRHGLLQG